MLQFRHTLRAAVAFYGLSTVNSERVWLSKFNTMPESFSLEIAHFATIREDQATEVSIAGPVSLINAEKNKVITDYESIPEGLVLSILDHKTLSYISTGPSSFCCTANFAKDDLCKLHTMFIPGGNTDPIQSFPISKKTLTNGFGDIMFKNFNEGIYYIALSNCNANGVPETLDWKFDSGELVISSRSGYLPGEELPKLSFYFYLLAGHIVALSLWILWCSRWTEVLFKIHHYITIAICVGALEAACWYISLYHWNYIGHRWWSMICLASFGTVFKQGVCYGLLLLACMGFGVTKAQLESKKIVQCFLLCAAFIMSDVIRQISMMLQDRVNGFVSTWKILLLITPGSLFVSILYVWIFSALQDTIRDLTENKQSVKLEVYTKLRIALVVVSIGYLALTVYDSLVIHSAEINESWSTRYIFSDVLSHLAFLSLIVTIMVLWRPNERSAHMAYSQQLDSIAGGEGLQSGLEMTDLGDMPSKTGRDFNSVDVELDDDPDDDDDFSFKKSMEEAGNRGNPVLE